MTEEEMLEVLKHNEAICSAMVGAMKALEYGVRTLIAVHPDPQLFNHTWQDIISDIPDKHIDTTAPNLEMFNASMSAMLGILTQQIERAAHS
ncbi:hypothetical protein [Dyella mobilis]|uniref:Uncharacterized protein n=1 Tax=Dyella mobilis TaxID=1849582 RepID=A0ABS2KAK1_9GAMM|nr:hypothetical protein [Dyella mobilis]MBM7128211.1 hypothetical protein [Dyella mobilis]GLR00029.1 hypothetical protein GCM10007863_44480 [Dyella mobilis]